MPSQRQLVRYPLWLTAGIAGVVGGTFQSLSPGEDIRFLLASLVVSFLAASAVPRLSKT